MDSQIGAKKKNQLQQQNQSKFFFAKTWKENANDDTDQSENYDANIFATVGGSGGTIQECETGFVTSRQPLAHATFIVLENRSFDAEIVVVDESAIDDIFNYSATDEIVMSNASNDGPDKSGVGSLDAVFGFSSDVVGR